jgi:hypothetical protein
MISMSLYRPWVAALTHPSWLDESNAVCKAYHANGSHVCLLCTFSQESLHSTLYTHTALLGCLHFFMGGERHKCIDLKPIPS